MPPTDLTENDLPLADNGTADPAPVPRGQRWRHSRLFLLPLFVIVFFSGGVLGLYFQPPGWQAAFRALGLDPGGGTDTPMAVALQQVSERAQIAVVSEGDVVALGRIIPEGDVITVSPPFGAGDARIATLEVGVGDTVAAGEILAVMDSRAQLEGAVETARANLAVSEATLLQTRESVRVSRVESEASLARAEATEVAALAERDRSAAVLERGVTTRAVLDDAMARAQEATRDVERARATLSRYAANNGQMQADVAVAAANVTAARATLTQAERDVEKAFVRAPAAGMVLDIHVRPGERPDTEGVLELGDTSQMTVEAEVYQTLIGRVAIGDPVEITADALSGPLSGQVTAIGLAIGRQSITSDDPAANTDARVVDVIVTLDEAASVAARRFTNLQVVTRIDAGRLE